MKKFLAALLACVMLLGVTALVGCGNNGTIPGNYSELAGEEDWNKVAEALSSETALGDTEEKGWSFGFDANADLTLHTLFGGKTTDAQAKISYLLALTQTSLTGKGSAELSATSSEDQKEEKMSLSGDVYNEDRYLYFDGKYSETGKDDWTGKLKIDVTNYLPGYSPAPSPDATVQAYTGNVLFETVPGLTDTDNALTGLAAVSLQEIAAELALKVEADFSDGVKIKISATEATFRILAKLLYEQAGATEDTATVAIDASVLEVYIHIDKNGIFAEAAAKADFGLTIGLPATDTAEESKTELSAKGTVSVKVNYSAPSLPDDLDRYEEQ